MSSSSCTLSLIHSLCVQSFTQVYDIEEKDPNAPPPAEGEEPPAPIVVQVPELAVVKLRIDMINDSTGVMPVVRVLCVRTCLSMSEIARGC